MRMRTFIKYWDYINIINNFIPFQDPLKIG